MRFTKIYELDLRIRFTKIYEDEQEEDGFARGFGI